MLPLAKPKTRKLVIHLLALQVMQFLSLPNSLAGAAIHCPATDSTQAGFYCPPVKSELPFKGQPPDELLACLTPVTVQYYDNSGQLKKGTLVVNRDLVASPEISIVSIFEEIRLFNRSRIKAGASFFPITSVIPVNQFGWSDASSMAADNTSAYNFRFKAGLVDFSALSMHSYGRAIDINPMCNPWVMTYPNGAKLIDPAGAIDPQSRGFFDVRPDCLLSRETELGAFVIATFERHGWQWGGDWTTPKDYQHFQYPSASYESLVKKAPYCK